MDALAQNLVANDARFTEEKAYWQEVFSAGISPAGIPPVLKARAGEHRVAVYKSGIGGKDYEELKKITGTSDFALYTYLLASLKYLLYRYTSAESTLIATPVFKKDFEPGLINSLLAFTRPVQQDSTFRELLNSCKEEVTAAYRMQSFPVAKVFSEVMESSFSGFAKTLLVLKDLQHTSYADNLSPDMAFVISRCEDALEIRVLYNESLYGEEYAAQVAAHFCRIITLTAADRDIRLDRLALLSAREEELLIFGLNDTRHDFPHTQTLHGLFLDQVQRTPDATAVTGGSRTLTYADLNREADRLAAVLLSEGLRAEEPVALLMERSEKMVTALLAVLKAGGAYVPIDPAYPADRIRFILSDCGATLLLVDGSSTLEADLFSGRVVDLSDESICKDEPFGLPLPPVDPGNLAYIIYTSGSTGKPKGAMLEHRGVVNRIAWMKERYAFGENDVVLQKTPYVFDVSVWEFFMTLCYGAKLVVCSREIIYDPELLLDVIEQYHVTTLHFVPSMLNTFLSAINATNRHKTGSIRQVFASGEALNPETAALFHARLNAELHNLYGPTEASVDVSHYETREGDELIPIGRPVWNISLYVLDSQLRPVPLGVAGELCISGVGVARGYLNRPGLSAEKFKEDPFRPGCRFYHTGDLARFLPGGNIEYLGRIDSQVKIRGYRIELGEIESRLLSHPDISGAVVVDKEDRAGGGKYLCAYYTASHELSFADLSEFLSCGLPEYMVPSYFVKLDSIPLTPNGKVNRRALPEPSGQVYTGIEYVAPSTPTEQRMAELWQEVLSVEKAGADDSFFQLGGHSLKATILISHIHRVFRVELPLRQIFKTPTIKGLSAFIDSSDGGSYTEIEPAPVQELYPMSSSQKRMFVLSRLEEGTGYNMPGAWLVKGRLDVAKITEVFRRMIRRHESLRTAFVMKDGEVLQKVYDHVDFHVDYVEGTEDNLDRQVEAFMQPFDLEKPPLIRVRIVRCAEDRFILMGDMHHIISDGTSIGVIMREFRQLYRGEEPEPLKVQYKDFALWQNKFFRSDALQRQRQFWQRQFSDIPLLTLSTDFPVPAVRSYEGVTIKLTLSQEEIRELRSFASSRGSTLFMVLLSAYNVFLSRYSGQDDIIVGIPIAGRPHADVQQLIGMFVNTLALRNRPRAGITFSQFLDEVKENTLIAFEHQDYPFEELVKELYYTRNAAHNPLFDTMFLHQNMEQGDLEAIDLEFSRHVIDNKISRLFITLLCFETEEDVHLHMEYSTQLFTEETAGRMFRHFRNLLLDIMRHPEKKISELRMLSAEEESVLLEVFNTPHSSPEGLYRTVQELFEERVARHPGRTALVSGNREYTFEELNREANRIAHYLRLHCKVKPEQKTGILMNRSADMVIALLAVIKSSAAYVPLDPSYPAGRLRSIVEDSGVQLVLSSADVEVPELPIPVVRVDALAAVTESLPAENPELLNRPEDLLYVLYTSGSTGKPKGVMVEHRNMTAFTENFGAVFPIGSTDTLLALTNFTFDISGLELVASFCCGVKVVLAGDDALHAPAKLVQMVREQEVNVLQLTPSRLQLMIDAEGADFLGSVKTLLVGGEAMPEPLFRLLKNHPSIEAFNVYGPTETTIWSTALRLRDAEKLTLGTPLKGEQVYILSETRSLCPPGVWGEIYIGGSGVSRGYYGLSQLSAERYITGPFRERGCLYRTGDRGRWLPDGTIEFGGRDDGQVKLRGYRIELGEIESVMLRMPGIEEAVALVKETGTGAELAGYYTSGREVDSGRLKKHLASHLPVYMIPAHLIRLEKMPLTSHGKINRNGMPDPEHTSRSTEPVPPRHRLDRDILALWEQVLEKDGIGIEDDFFHLGGQSMKGILMLSRLSRLTGREVPLLHFFRMPTVKALSDYLEETSAVSAEQDYLLLEQGISPPVFFLPPAIGYSFVYKSLSDKLGPRSVYAFNYIEDPAGAVSYAEHIVRLQPEGPFLLCGYSSGGNLAFHVAAELEKQGRQLSALVLIDSYSRHQARMMSPEELDREVQSYYQADSDLLPEGYGSRQVEAAIQKTRSYLRYLSATEERGRLKADIFLVRSETPDEENTDPGISREGWAGLTTGRLHVLQGKGIHREMLRDTHLEANAALLKSILAKL